MRRIAACVAVLAVALFALPRSLPAFATEVDLGAEAARDPAIAAALDFLDAANSRETMKNSLLTELPKLIQQIRTSNPEISDERLRELETALREEFLGTLDFLIFELAKVYARRLSIDDLKAAARFYRSPEGRRIVAEQPAIARDAQRAVVNWLLELTTRLTKRFKGTPPSA